MFLRADQCVALCREKSKIPEEEKGRASKYNTASASAQRKSQGHSDQAYCNDFSLQSHVHTPHRDPICIQPALPASTFSCFYQQQQQRQQQQQQQRRVLGQQPLTQPASVHRLDLSTLFGSIQLHQLL